MARYRIWINRATIHNQGKDPVCIIECEGVRKMAPPVRILGESWFETNFEVPLEEPRIWVATDGPIEPDPFNS